MLTIMLMTASINAAAANHASDEQFGLAINLHAGLSHLHGSTNLDNIEPSSVISVDDDSNSWGINLSYRLNQAFILELGYEDLGEGSAALDGGTPNYHQSVSKATPVFGEGITLGLQYHFWQYQEFSSYLTTGAYFWSSDLVSRLGSEVIEHKEDGTDPYLGLGLQYRITSSTSANIMVRRYYLGPNDVDNISFGVSMHF